MSYGRYLRELLAPLRLYDLEAPFNGGELNVQGGALDGVDTWLAELRRESTLAEAESWGLERIIALLARRPVADTPTGMRKALAALMRIGGDSFTLDAINATISGCGVHAHVEEKEIPGEVAVSFPDIPGIPKGFKEIREIIEDILPAHLGIEYVFWYITWEELERKISCWAEIEERQLTWEQLETLVDETEEWAGTWQSPPTPLSGVRCSAPLSSSSEIETSQDQAVAVVLCAALPVPWKPGQVGAVQRAVTCPEVSEQCGGLLLIAAQQAQHHQSAAHRAAGGAVTHPGPKVGPPEHWPVPA